MPTTDDSRSDQATCGAGDLDARKAAILNAVVTEYIGSAQPVGSQHVVDAPGVSVSSATVRSDMAALERDGFLTQPHTSAGRIPTDKGYRFFVDHLGGTGSLDPVGRHQVRQFFDHAHGEIELMLEKTSGLLADLTDCTAMVVGPSHESAAIRSVQLVRLAPHLALLVVVLADGAVQKQSIEFAEEVDEHRLPEAAARLAAHVLGVPLAQVPPTANPSGDAHTDAVVSAGIMALRALGSAEGGDQLFVGGSSRMAAAFDAVDTVRSVLSILEQQLVVVTLLRDILDTGLSVAIGTEHGVEPLASCAIVVMPISVDGVEAGTIGLLGPTRMNYPLALAAARVVGGRLGERLSETGR
ncbi:MAG TPA: heat-inducible transcriptional repressor HrcA [Acidimicrobiales bacterium]|jgi:heat-inducible transcriptional repressor|nr:heat-inducible transcriptional repressor HrcA [Acidimicrobiales bacterium]